MYRSSQVEADAFHHQFLDHMPALAFTLAASTHECEYVNQPWLKYSGQNEEEALGHGWRETLHVEDGPAFLAGLRAALNKGLDFHGEVRLRRADAAYRWFDVRVKPLRGDDAQPRCWVGTCMDVHERQQALQALREQAARTRHNVESNPNGMMVVDAAGEVLEANPSACAMFAYAQEQLIGMHVEQLIPEQLRAAHRRYRHDYQRAPTTRRMGTGRDLLGVRSDGQTFPVEVSIGPFMMNGVRYVSVTLTDISARVRAEREHAHLAAIVGSSSDAIISQTLEGRITSWNRAASEIFGYTAEEMLNESVDRLLAPERSEEDAHIMVRIQAGEVLRHHETQRMAKDGTLIDVSISISPLRDAEGRIIGASKIMRDIRERKRNELQLRALTLQLEEQVVVRTAQYEQARRDLQNIFDAMPSLISSWDAGQRNRLSNRAHQRWVGGEANELLGRALLASVPAELYAQLQAPIVAVLRGEAQTLETRLPTASGTRQPHALIHLVPDVQPSGVVGFYLLIHDVTRIKDAEAELRAANSELEAFSYAVAHDLRAPLRAMSGFGEALREECVDSLNEDGREYLDEILRASSRMARLIDGLLALSRSTQGNLRREWVDLTQLAQAVCAESDAAHEQEAKPPKWEIESGVVAHGDPRMLETVLRNLFGNARKYSAQVSQPVIRFYSELSGGMRRYYVGDNGAGFDMAHADHLFKPFQRLHRQDEFKGIGIGLATVQRIVQRHGGTITARSEPGQGALFCFTLGDASAINTSLRD